MLNIGLFHFPLLEPCSFLFTPPLPSNPICHQLSHRECFLFTCFIDYYSYPIMSRSKVVKVRHTFECLNSFRRARCTFRTMVISLSFSSPFLFRICSIPITVRSFSGPTRYLARREVRSFSGSARYLARREVRSFSGSARYLARREVRFFSGSAR